MLDEARLERLGLVDTLEQRKRVVVAERRILLGRRKGERAKKTGMPV